MSDHDRNAYSATFFIVPSYILDLPGMTLGFLRVYEAIFQFWNHNKSCFLSEKTICEKSNLKRTQIYEALAFFERHNEVKRVRKGMKRFLIRPEKIIETDCIDIIPKSAPPDISTTISQTSAPPDSDVRSTGRNTSAPPDYNKKKLTKEVKKTTTSVVSSSDFVISEKTDKDFLEYKLVTDDRSDRQFLEECQKHIKTNSDPKLFLNQRKSGMKQILKRCFEDGEYFAARDLVTKKSKEDVNESSSAIPLDRSDRIKYYMEENKRELKRAFQQTN